MGSLQLPSVLAALQIPLLYLNTMLALAVGPRHQFLRVSVSLPILIVLAAQSLYREWDGEWGIQYALDCMVLSASFVYVDWILLSSPDKEGWRKIQYKKTASREGKTQNGRANGLAGKQEVSAAPVGWWARLWWAARLATTTRYVGWSCQVKNVPVEVDAGYPRLLFIARKSLRAIFFYLLQDILYAYTASSPHGSWRDIAHLKVAVSYASSPFWSRFWYAWVHIVLSYVTLEMCNAAYGVVSVATGLANPRDCPSAFGDLRGLVSVRKAWSSVWHQQCRRICSAPGIYIARDALCLPKGSFASKYLQLFVGFGVSAIAHGGASMLIHGSFDDDAAFAFFIGQATIIMIEDHVIDFGKRLGFKDSVFWRLVGFSWTVFAIGASCEKWTGNIIGHGMWVHDRQPDWFGIGPKIVA